jgi:hypothetical protein
VDAGNRSAIQNVRDKHQRDWAHGMKQEKEQKQASFAAAATRLLQDQAGVTDYADAMSKASKMCHFERPVVQKVPKEMQPGNAHAAKFLRLLKGHSSMRISQSLKVQQGKLVTDALAQWRAVEPTEEPEQRLHRPWHVLAGPCFSPARFYHEAQADIKESVIKDTPKAPGGPDVSHIPRPSDRLAFTHPERPGMSSVLLQQHAVDSMHVACEAAAHTGNEISHH